MVTDKPKRREFTVENRAKLMKELEKNLKKVVNPINKYKDNLTE